MAKSIATYFDLQSAARGATPKGNETTQKKLHVIPQYLALVLGIAVQPFLVKFQESGTWALDGWLGWSAFAIIVGLLVFPAVYKNSFEAGKPGLVQFSMIFSGGMGWESLLSTAEAIV